MPTIGATIAHPHIAYSKVWISSRLPLGGDGVDEVHVMKRSMRKNRHGGAFLFSKVGEALDVKGMLKSKTPHGRGVRSHEGGGIFTKGAPRTGFRQAVRRAQRRKYMNRLACPRVRYLGLD